jgi:hypothetical protein
MKCSALITLLASAVVLLSCAPLPSPAPLSAQYSGANQTAYRRGYHLGFQDGNRGQEENYQRFHREYSSVTADAFQHGYKLGFETGEDQSDADETALNAAKTDGDAAGRTDAENGLSPFYQRHRAAYRQQTETSFREGYVRGFNAARDHSR